MDMSERSWFYTKGSPDMSNPARPSQVSTFIFSDDHTAPRLSTAERALIEAQSAAQGETGGLTCPNCRQRCRYGELSCPQCGMMFSAGGKTQQMKDEES